jgi:hypothetical protein
MDREGVLEVEEFEQTSGVQRESGRQKRHRYVW